MAVMMQKRFMLYKSRVESPELRAENPDFRHAGLLTLVSVFVVDSVFVVVVFHQVTPVMQFFLQLRSLGAVLVQCASINEIL